MYVACVECVACVVRDVCCMCSVCVYMCIECTCINAYAYLFDVVGSIIHANKQQWDHLAKIFD
jgi:hypothetical protein